MSSSLKFKVALGLILVFVAGLATGVFAGAWHAHRAFADRHDARMAERLRDRMARQLNLTPEQLQKITPILDDTAKRLQEIRTESGKRVSDTIEQSHQQLATYLTPEQQAELKKMEQRHRRPGGPRRGPPGPPPDLP